MSKKNQIIHIGNIRNRIFTMRGVQVMVDRDLAELYCVETRVLNQAVKRNIKRFPPEFMFRLTKEEMENWKSQIVISNKEKSIKPKQGIFYDGQVFDAYEFVPSLKDLGKKWFAFSKMSSVNLNLLKRLP